MKRYRLRIAETNTYDVVVRALSMSAAVKLVESNECAPELITQTLDSSTQVVAAELEATEWLPSEK